MNVILMEKIGRLGNLGDRVNVKPGYARNFLIPQGKAIPATEGNLKVFESRRAELEKTANEHLKQAQARVDKIAGIGTITITARAADEGRLYGSIGTREISEAVTKAGVKVEKSEVRLPAGALRNIGEVEIMLQLHTDVSANVKINIVGES